MKPYYSDPLVTLLHGDCVEQMTTLDAESVDAVVTDPPYGLEFMGKEWDKLRNNWEAEPGRYHNDTNFLARGDRIRYQAGKPMQAWHEAWATEAFRVAKPGAYLLAFGGTRTVHRLAAAIEDAGWEIRDQLAWIYGQGFPKSLNVSKQEVFCQCERIRQLPTEHQVPRLRQGDVSAPEVAPGGSGSVLLKAVQEQGAWLRGTDGPNASETEAAIRAEERSLEGRGDVLQDEGQLHRSPVRSSSGVGEADGPEGRLHHGAPAGHGRVDGPAAGPDGSREPQGPQPVEQSAGEPRAVAVQRDAQGGGVWPVCDRCGKPQIPDGLGTALKPAMEPIVMARKPLVGTVAANVTRFGTGAINIDGSRIPSEAGGRPAVVGHNGKEVGTLYEGGFGGSHAAGVTDQGRWPSNVLLSDPELFDQANPYVVGSGATTQGSTGGAERSLDGGRSPMIQQAPREGLRNGYDDPGGYSRFFIIPKADRAERERGLRLSPKVKLRADLTDEQRAFVLEELRAAGVPT